MWSTLIAVMGTLAGALISGLLQHQVTTRADRAKRAEQLRRDQLAAVTELADAISSHRRAMWMREDAALSGAPADRVRELRGESHVTRSAVTRPLVSVRLLIADPDVRTAAETAVTATYSLRNASTAAALDQARQTALTAHDLLIDAARGYLTTT
jgi:hypothetical protein